jgi:hypothetical protein
MEFLDLDRFVKPGPFGSFVTQMLSETSVKIVG